MADPIAARPVAAIDCGTNAIRLLVASVDADGVLDEIVRELRIVRLGEGVDATGAFSEPALARTFAACDEYAGLIAHHRVGAIRFAATSASRDATNREAFIAGVRERLGVTPEVISGDEEAELSFLGAVRGLPAAPTSPVVVVDIGGGSTEFVHGTFVDGTFVDGAFADRTWRLDCSVSVDIGCVRMTERHLHADPPTPDQIASVQADVDAALDAVRLRVPVDDAASLVGLAGTVTTMAAMAMDLDRYDAARQHGATISVDEIEAVTEELLRMSRAERAGLPFMHPGRVDVIGGGAIILRAIMRRFAIDRVIVSECDLLDGMVYRACS
jgi:exopolyphosphatase/guanosine-5'-triphosphate,3'-diphosphate pyrophosphatase